MDSVNLTKEGQKKQWQKPAVMKLDVAMTQSGANRTEVEDPNYNFYGPVS